jgi:hypothetical protein
MSIETELIDFFVSESSVAAIIGNDDSPETCRIYPLRLPQGYILPAISFQRISTDREHVIDDGPIGWAWARFQFDMWAETYEEVRPLAEAVRQALDGHNNTMGSIMVAGAFAEGERDLYEEQTEIYRVTQDYLIPYKETL